jgi:molybdopterin/thiamine biosynthesis adenylyltransferase
VDKALLERSKIVIVGTGGAYEVSGMFTRSGIGEMVGIDPDTVDATNLCRQGYLPRQVGMRKVEALWEYVREINPDIKFSGYPVKLQELTPEQEHEIFASASLAIFTTDSFDAQASGNKKSLQYNIPAIWGGFYEKSLASEIVFYIPGVTPACFRCAVSPRYKFQEEYKANNNGKELSISSACNTIFHSALLDAQIGMLAMAIIHNKVEGKTFSGWFGDYFDRTLIQMNVNPLYQSRLFDRVFAGAGDSAFLFESVWQHIEPERPPKYALCPDCHGGVNQESAHTENEETSEENKD